jgi:4,5-DOPA dioxygenase extradiol
MPVPLRPVFVGHGSPENAVADNAYTRFLSAFAAARPKPRALVVVSAHWRTAGSFVTAKLRPDQLFDFYGFPDALYRLRYAPLGDPDLARLIAGAGLGVGLDPERGIDHAAWAVACRMYPDADVPLLEMSLDVRKPPSAHLELGAALGALKLDGVLFVGSGNLVHNLGDLAAAPDAPAFPWATAADAWIADRAEAGAAADLADYRRRLPDWHRAIPTDEHFLPLFYILGMAGRGGRLATLHQSMQHGSISMRCLETA